mgnify:CR=1 FL=1
MNAENTAMTPAAENAVVETATESIAPALPKRCWPSLPVTPAARLQ